jgi:pyruvate/oxaloacetate carboxyltransferase
MTKSIQLTDLTLRDGNQSIAATSMTRRTNPAHLPMLQRAGYTRMELWGGAILDSCIRFLNEDPWERLEAYARILGGSGKIQASCAGRISLPTSPTLMTW